ncbi:MAG: Lrp/AsnC family transcriptional regulator [Beduini sp.]|uniref:Lrp/AsnC family transcriptional regulator n=1 Tax=Beduini sp. TaxID=1922300 RepID=UPI0039A12AF6
MDEIDAEILNLLAKNGRISIKQISAIVNLSSPAVSTRIEKLEEHGFLHGYQAQLDLDKAGYPIKAFIHVAMKPSRKPEFYEFIAKIPNVLECCCVTGDYSMLIKVAFDSTQKLDLFIGKLQKFGDTMTQIVFSTIVEPRQAGISKSHKKKIDKSSTHML